MILIIPFLETGCVGGIRVKLASDCIWAEVAPDLTSSHVEVLLHSDIDDDTLAALNTLDNFIDKHNEKYAKFC